jgi:hypothetical protein
VRCSDKGAIQIGEQHRQAVSHHDGASDITVGSDTRIGYRAIWYVGLQCHYIGAMHLLQINGLSAYCLRQMISIDGNMFCPVAHMVAQIQGAKRRNTHTAMPRGEHRFNVRWRWPVGNEPVRLQNRGS